MLSADKEGFPRAEEAIRLLASAVGSARLYPPGSALPLEAAERFTARINELTANGPLRFIVDPHGFRVGDTEVAAGQSQVVAFAESLHAMQVGQLVIVPGVTERETRVFVEVANTDPKEIRAGRWRREPRSSAGGVTSHRRHRGLAACVRGGGAIRPRSHDRAARRDRGRGGEGRGAPSGAAAVRTGRRRGRRRDRPARGRDPRACDGAYRRCDDAARRGDSRARALDGARRPTPRAAAWRACSDVIARMKPAALARLFTLVAAQAGIDPSRIAAAIELPPETAKLLAFMLAPTPDVDLDSGVRDDRAGRAARRGDGRSRRTRATSSGKSRSPRRRWRPAARSRPRPPSRAPARTSRRCAPWARCCRRPRVTDRSRRCARRCGGSTRSPPNRPSPTRSTQPRSTLAEPEVLADVCRVSVL